MAMVKAMMFGPAGRYAQAASGMGEGMPEQNLSYMEATKFDPQELMEFLEFCGEKIHGERKGATASSRAR